MFTLDHVIIAVHDLDQAMADYRALGFTVVYGGRHASSTTHNALIGLADGAYLELIAQTGEATQPGMADYSALFAQGEGLIGYSLRSRDVAADAAALRARGAAMSEVSEGHRMRSDGIEVRWRASAFDGGLSPFLVEDVTPHELRVPDGVAHANGVTGIAQLEGADFESLRGNQRLTGIVFSAPAPVIFDPALTHGASLLAQ